MASIDNRLHVVSPVDGSVYLERELASSNKIQTTFENARSAFDEWKLLPLEERIELCECVLEFFLVHQEQIAEEITWQMGRPIQYATGEVNGLVERGRAMLSIAHQKLHTVTVEPQSGFKRYIRREPLGIVFSMTPWNYPFLTAINLVIPAIIAGNVVVMKASAQTPRAAERFDEAFKYAGVFKNVFQYLHLDHDATQAILQKAPINFVGFTGSVSGGAAVEKALAGRFINTGLELGGKDPAYVREDAKLEHSIANLVDGAYFNSGQSCCGVERIYVHKKIYRDFVDGFVELGNQYKLDDPTIQDSTLGPLVRTSAASHVRNQIAQAVSKGAKPLIDEKLFTKSQDGSAYLAPQVLIDVDHSMDVMREETFGPVVGIMPVASDEEALLLMNDSQYGLTASIWTTDLAAAENLGRDIQTGTVFMNRCDYLDPYLAWTGIGHSGKGCTLSEIGYEHVTRPKSFHLKT